MKISVARQTLQKWISEYIIPLRQLTGLTGNRPQSAIEIVSDLIKI